MIDTGPHGLVNWYNSNCRIGFEDGKRREPAPANPVRDFVAFWCLSARESLASGFDLPQLRIELRGPANSEVKAAAKMSGFSRHFFYHKRSLLSGQLCPTLPVNCLADARCLGGVRSWMSDKPSQLYIHTMTLNLGTSVSPSYRIKVSHGQHNFCADHTNLDFVNFFLGATKRACNMTVKVLRLEELN